MKHLLLLVMLAFSSSMFAMDGSKGEPPPQQQMAQRTAPVPEEKKGLSDAVVIALITGAFGLAGSPHSQNVSPRSEIGCKDNASSQSNRGQASESRGQLLFGSKVFHVINVKDLG